MSVERTYFCEGPGCNDGQPRHVTTADAPPHLPESLIETREQLNGADYVHHFCGWDCLMRFAAGQAVPETIGGFTL